MTKQYVAAKDSYIGNYSNYSCTAVSKPIVELRPRLPRRKILELIFNLFLAKIQYSRRTVLPAYKLSVG